MAAERSDLIAEGTGPHGEHWALRAGGSEDDFYTTIETSKANGPVDAGGMGGPMLTAGSPVNIYYGTSGRGFLRVIARTEPTVEILRLRTAETPIDLAPVGMYDKRPLKFFAAILPDTVRILSVEAFDKGGSLLAQHNTERQAAALRKFIDKNRSR